MGEFLFRLLLVNERAQSNMQKGWGVRHIIAIIILAGFMVACDRVERPKRISSAGSDAFCETLREIRRTENKFSEVPNELYGLEATLRSFTG